MWSNVRLYVVLVLIFASRSARCEQQYFRVAPRNMKVHEGGEAVLECEVSSLAGQVQWAKDGFVLGFAAQIPGCPRYTMVGDRAHGVYNLRIVNASLEDDAEFQCQVGPARRHDGIRANASLTVIAPPTSVDIVGHASGSKLEIREGADVTLECRAKNAKPAARVVWYRGSVELKPDRYEDEIIEIDDPSGNKKKTRYTTRSRIHIKPSSEDDYAEFSCEARHEALQRDLPMRSSVQLSVLYPPGAPYIEGYAPGETVRRGQNIELVCRSRGGNPPAQLIWYKNGEQVRMAYRTSGRMSENVLSFVADSSDNKARYRCEAKNIMISNTLKAEIDLTVLFAPAQVTITGASEARIGDPVALTCATAPSNPPAVIKWLVMGKAFRNDTNRTVLSPEGGWVTSSNITFLVERNKRSIVVLCHGVNHQLTENVVSTHTINVLYPPSVPTITGYTPGSILAAGTVQKLLCMSMGGNPLASLTWFKNDKKVHSTIKVSDKTESVSAELLIHTNVTDNQAQYRCEATNSATDIPLFEAVTLSVHFPPEAVKVRTEPPELRPGEPATLVCDSASSNPPAALSWWRDGIPVRGSPATSKPGLHGGTVSTIELKLNITKEMNGAIYTCQAMNEALQRSEHGATALKVLYAPVFVEPQREVAGAENDSLVVALRADGNPASISYTWTKDGHPIAQYGNGADRTISEGSALNMTRLSREDAGVYTCEALNSQGAATVNITVSVHYAPAIEAVSGYNLVTPGEDALLWCTASGNPLSEEHFTWRRTGYAKFETKTTTTFDAKNGTSYLHIQNADRDDVGKFECVVNNGVGRPATKEVLAVVKFAPEMDNAPNRVKFATNKGVEGRLVCSCDAAPAPVFVWSKSGSVLPVNASSKYYSKQTSGDGTAHTSVLLVGAVNSHDYGKYECVARNEMGEGKVVLQLNVTSVPDEVISLRVTNVTHDTVTLEWVPGFDGGVTATYKIRYRKLDDRLYVEEGPIHTTRHVVRNLERATEYVFSVMAMNERGASRYRPDDTRVATLTLSELGELSVPTPREDTNKDSQVMVYVSISAAILLLSNVALIGCFLWRRRARQMKEQAGQSSKSATIEMYAPSSYNDTMTGETLSSVSEKSETYSADEDDRRIPPPIPEVPIMHNRHMIGQTDSYMLEDPGLVPPPALDYPPPNYAPYDADAHARTLPHPHRHKETLTHTLGRNTGKQAYAPAPSPMPPLDGSYYNMSSDRYLSYPPLVSDYMHHGQIPPPPQQYTSPQHKMATESPVHAGGSPPPNYMHDHSAIPLDRQSAGGTLRRQRLDKMAVPPPDVTVLHATCNQKHNRSPPTQVERQPQSILKDPSRQKYQSYQHNSPVSTSTPISNSSQILTVQNLAADVPQYGTIRKDKKNNVTIDETFNKRETHVV